LVPAANSSGLVRIGHTLRPRRTLPPAPPRVFRTREEIAQLVDDLLPALTAQGLELRTENLPDVAKGEPRIYLDLGMDPGGGTELRVSARIGYEESAGVWREDPAAEKNLARRLQHEFHLAVGRYTNFSPSEALAFTSRMAEVARAEPALWRLQGEGLRKFARAPM
jgi:Asp-tRNA(Asn)/Glu-tRNA(Gln) amidotransferase A subunit family amidase